MISMILSLSEMSQLLNTVKSRNAKVALKHGDILPIRRFNKKPTNYSFGQMFLAKSLFSILLFFCQISLYDKLYDINLL